MNRLAKVSALARDLVLLPVLYGWWTIMRYAPGHRRALRPRPGR